MSVLSQLVSRIPGLDDDNDQIKQSDAKLQQFTLGQQFSDFRALSGTVNP